MAATKRIRQLTLRCYLETLDESGRLVQVEVSDPVMVLEAQFGMTFTDRLLAHGITPDMLGLPATATAPVDTGNGSSTSTTPDPIVVASTGL